MPDLNAWECLSALCRMAVAVAVIVKLVLFFDHYKPSERFGLGVAGGCSLMTVPAVIQGPASPFAGWAGALFAFGVLVYFVGRLQRQFHHRAANREQIRRAMERNR
jgi:hypothetical protein